MPTPPTLLPDHPPIHFPRPTHCSFLLTRSDSAIHRPPCPNTRLPLPFCKLPIFLSQTIFLLIINHLQLLIIDPSSSIQQSLAKYSLEHSNVVPPPILCHPFGQLLNTVDLPDKSKLQTSDRRPLTSACHHIIYIYPNRPSTILSTTTFITNFHRHTHRACHACLQFRT